MAVSYLPISQQNLPGISGGIPTAFGKKRALKMETSFYPPVLGISSIILGDRHTSQ